MRMSVELELRELFLCHSQEPVNRLLSKCSTAFAKSAGWGLGGPLHNQTAFFLLMLCYLKEYLS